MIVWLAIRKEMNETNQRTQIALAAIEKNPELDLEELMKKISPKQKMLKEKLLNKLLWGCLMAMLGLGLIGFGIYLSLNNLGGYDDPMTSIGFGLALLGIGIAFLVNYYVGKKMLFKEMEAEQNKLLEKA
jgi:hypothetical protein